MAKTGSTPNHNFSTTIKPLRTNFNFIKFYASRLKVIHSVIRLGKGNVFHKDIIYVASKNCFPKRDIFAKNTLSLKLIPTLDLSYQRL